MKISVVLPTNRPIGYRYAFSSLAKQTFPLQDWEFIVVTDSPTFTTEDASMSLEAERCRFDFLHLISKPNYWRSNRLIANARNTALKYASGELVVFLDDFCWVRPKWLQEHWNTWKRTKMCMLGGMKAVPYVKDRYDGMDQVGALEVSEESGLTRGMVYEALMRRQDELGKESAVNRNIRLFGVTDTRGPVPKKDCGGIWFYSCNASAPLDKLIEVNGFDEEFDLTSEEDIDLGLRLGRVGVRFYYRPEPDCTVFHVDHMWVDRELLSAPKRYKPVTYDELRARGVTETMPDEVQLVPKEKYGTRYDGSWGLHDRNHSRSPRVNEGIFDLRSERRRK